MRLVPSAEQQRFADVLEDLLAGADVAAVAQSWARGDTAAGRTLWSRLADVGVAGLVAPERWGGLGGTPGDLVVVCEVLGRHALPGPVAESVAAVPALLTALSEAGPAGKSLSEAGPAGKWLSEAGPAGKWLPELVAGRVLATLAAPPLLPYALDAHAAELVLLAHPDAIRLARPGVVHASLDPARHPAEVIAGEPIAAGPQITAALARALDFGALACAAQLLGAGRALLDTAVAYAKTRVQFGRPIGSFQAVQHQLADAAVGLEFARPLLYAAAVAVGASSPTAARDVSAAAVACADAAQVAARTALQVHGAIGYTREYGLGRWLTKVRVLRVAWGTPAYHRSRVMAELTR